MKNRLIIGLMILATAGLICGCKDIRGVSMIKGNEKMTEPNDMKTLTIKWQRLVDEKGHTCERCGSTGKEVEKAFHNLEKSLAPLGIKVILEKKALDPDTCAKDISQSNRIWIGERSLEEWLGAKVGKSPCDSCCSEIDRDVECRTIKVGERIYEAIPAELIVKAGLQAASKLIDARVGNSCCPKKPVIKKPISNCCPESDSSSKNCK